MLPKVKEITLIIKLTQLSVTAINMMKIIKGKSLMTMKKPLES